MFIVSVKSAIVIVKRAVLVFAGFFVFSLNGMQPQETPPRSMSNKRADVAALRVIIPKPIRPVTHPVLSQEEAARVLLRLNPPEPLYPMPALHAAAFQGNADMVAKLLGAGEKCNALDSAGTSSLAHAIDNGHRDVILMLLKFGALVIKNNKKDNTLLYAARIKASAGLLRALESFAAECVRCRLRFPTRDIARVSAIDIGVDNMLKGFDVVAVE